MTLYGGPTTDSAVFTSDIVSAGALIWLIAPGYAPVYFTCVPDAMFCTGSTRVAPLVVVRTVKSYLEV